MAAMPEQCTRDRGLAGADGHGNVDGREHLSGLGVFLELVEELLSPELGPGIGAGTGTGSCVGVAALETHFLPHKSNGSDFIHQMGARRLVRDRKLLPFQRCSRLRRVVRAGPVSAGTAQRLLPQT